MQVGDEVIVHNATSCKHGYSDTMSNYNERHAIITEAQGNDRYKIDIDMGRYTWCSNTLENALTDMTSTLLLISTKSTVAFTDILTTALSNNYVVSTVQPQAPDDTYTLLVEKQSIKGLEACQT